MNQHLVIVEARKALLTAIKARIAPARLVGVDGPPELAVVYRYSTKIPARKVIAAGDVEGDVSIRAMTAGRKPRLSEFDLRIFCACGPGSVELDTSDPLDPEGFASLDEAVLELVQIIDDELAENPRQGADGWIATLAGIEGPNASTETDGAVSAAIVTVHFEVHHR